MNSRVLRKQAELDLNRTQELADRNLASQADLDRDGLDVEGLMPARAGQQEVVVAERSLAVQRQLLTTWKSGRRFPAWWWPRPPSRAR